MPHDEPDPFEYENIKAESHVITITVHFDNDPRPYLIKFPIDRTWTSARAAIMIDKAFAHLADNTHREIKKRLQADLLNIQ